MHHIAAPYSFVRLTRLLLLAVIAAGTSIGATAATVPTISGTPAKSVIAGDAYRFKPTATVPAGTTLSFSIANKPAWASFSASAGTLAGVPGAGAAGTFSNIKISASDGKAKATLPAFSITVTAPTISGTPAKSVTAGHTYKFKPIATTPAGTTLSFSIVNKPAWATFSAATGTLAGWAAVADAGTYSNIKISASDGVTKATLPAFAVTVNEIGTKSATLSWSAPTVNTDGSPLANLAGYRIYFGTSKTELKQSITVSSIGITTYVISNLSSGTYYFAIRAYTTTGSESDLSNVVSRSV
jgi:Putative Ig domain/Fibronectin type III domain